MKDNKLVTAILWSLVLILGAILYTKITNRSRATPTELPIGRYCSPDNPGQCQV